MLYLPYQIASVEGVMQGLYLLWWVQERHVSAAVAAAILAAGDFALMLLEVPTGWFADRCGHRASLIVGSSVQAVAMVCCWLGQGVPGLLAASLLVALGDGFRSGADQALLYRTCVSLDARYEFQRIEARTRALLLAALVGLIVAGGVIVERWGFAAGWIAEIALSVVGLALACAMVEPPTAVAAGSADFDRRDGTEVSTNHNVVDVVRAAAFRRLAVLVLPAALLGAASSASTFLAQTSTFDPASATRLVAAITLAEAAGSAASMRVALGSIRGQLLLAALGALVAVVSLVGRGALGPTAVCLGFLAGAAHPSRAAAVQSIVREGVRARAASAAHACDMALQMIALPVAGRWRRSARA